MSTAATAEEDEIRGGPMRRAATKRRTESKSGPATIAQNRRRREALRNILTSHDVHDALHLVLASREDFLALYENATNLTHQELDGRSPRVRPAGERDAVEEFRKELALAIKNATKTGATSAVATAAVREPGPPGVASFRAQVPIQFFGCGYLRASLDEVTVKAMLRFFFSTVEVSTGGDPNFEPPYRKVDLLFVPGYLAEIFPRVHDGWGEEGGCELSREARERFERYNDPRHADALDFALLHAEGEILASRYDLVATARGILRVDERRPSDGRRVWDLSPKSEACVRAFCLLAHCGMEVALRYLRDEFRGLSGKARPGEVLSELVDLGWDLGAQGLDELVYRVLCHDRSLLNGATDSALCVLSERSCLVPLRRFASLFLLSGA